MITPEQKARDMLERMGVENAQSFSAGQVGELAQLLAERLPVQARSPDRSADAVDVATMRMLACALAFQWFGSSGFKPDPEAWAYQVFRPADFHFHALAMDGLRIRVALSFERDER